MQNYDESAAALFPAVFLTCEDVDSPKVVQNKSFQEFK